MEWSSKKFGHIFQSLTNPSGWSVDMTVELSGKSEQKTRRFGSSVVYGMDVEGMAHRASWMVQREHNVEDNNFVMCVDVDARLPATLMFKRKEMIPSEVEHKTVIKAAFGKSCANDRKITLVVSNRPVSGNFELAPSLFVLSPCRANGAAARRRSPPSWCPNSRKSSARRDRHAPGAAV